MADYTLSAKITGDSSGFEKAFSTAQKSVDNLEKKIPNAFKGVSKQAGKSLAEIASESGKTMNEVRSDVMKAAAEYEKAGMTKSEAMKQAYADIGYSAEAANRKSRTALGDTENALEKVAQKALSVGERLKSIGDKFTSAGKKISSVGDSLTSKITKPALAAGAALAGITIGKGFIRLTGIDDARAKLQGLGHDAQTIEAIMDSALTSVQGTAFGLDEAATTAANAVAAGIKPGQELTKYLTMTADAAAIAGTSMSEMGSIINKVQTGQTVYTEDLEQLADRGLPVYQWLAEEAGVAASEVKQLASDGQISSQMLYNAIEKNIGGAAQIMGETSFSAAVDNIGASIARIGANFLDAGGQGGGFFSQLKPLMAEFSDKLSEVEVKATELGVKFGEAFANTVQKIREVKARFDELPASTQNIITSAVGIGAAVMVGIGPALKVIGALVNVFGGISGIIGGAVSSFGLLAARIAEVGGMKAAISAVFTAITGPVGIAVAAITALVGAFTYLMATNESFRSSIMGTVSVIGSSFQTVLAALLPVLQTLAVTIGTTIAATLQALAPIIAQIVATIGQVIAQIAPLVAMLIGQLAPVITTIITTVGQVISALLPAVITILQSIMMVIQMMLPIIMSVITTVVQVVSSVIDTISPIVSFVAGIIADVMGVISPIISFVAGVVVSIVSTITPIASTVASVFNTIFSTVSSIMSRVGSVISGVFNSIRSAWSGLTGFVSGVFSGITGAVQTLVSQVKGFVNGVISGINAAIGVINMIPGVSIGSIPYLAHGTDNWQGGFAVMNEGGRGELTYLPNGAQVIPHDISVKYAKEAARNNATVEPLDATALGQYIVAAVGEQGAQIADGVERGISGMKFTARDKEVMRYMESLGFVRG